MGLYLDSDPRMDDGKLDASEMTLLELFLFLYILASCVSTVLVSAKQAINSASYGRLFFTLMIWPLSYYFLWQELNRDKSNDPSFKDITKSVNQ